MVLVQRDGVVPYKVIAKKIGVKESDLDYIAVKNSGIGVRLSDKVLIFSGKEFAKVLGLKGEVVDTYTSGLFRKQLEYTLIEKKEAQIEKGGIKYNVIWNKIERDFT